MGDIYEQYHHVKKSVIQSEPSARVFIHHQIIIYLYVLDYY